LRTLSEFTAALKDVSIVSNLPAIVDADTWFGEDEMSAKTLNDFFYAEVWGLHIENQFLSKRYGNLNEKELIPTTQMVNKVKIAHEMNI